ncbi:MAG TPA: hypothetical protein VIC30_09140 [Orrella sp.]
MRQDLANWGAWSRAGSTLRLGYTSMSWDRKSQGELYDSDAALKAEAVLTGWYQASELAAQRVFVLKLVYVEQRSNLQIVPHFKRKFKRLSDESEIGSLADASEFYYWVLTR